MKRKTSPQKQTGAALTAPVTKPENASSLAGYDAIHTGIVDLLQAARIATARNVNALMTASYWEVGRRIVEAEQKGRRRASYGERLIERLSADLTAQFGRGFSARNIEQMRAFYSMWPKPQTLSAVSGGIIQGQPTFKLNR